MSAFAVACALLLPAQEDLAVVSTLQVPDGTTVADAVLVDFDGVGRADLVLARAGDRRRTVAVHLREGDLRFDPEPDRELELTPDVVAFAVADVDPAPGAELVLFNARGAFAWKPDAPVAERFVKLFETDFLWQLAESDDVFAWTRARHDLDDDGLDDLFVPEPGGYRAAFQRRDADGVHFRQAHRLRIPRGASGKLVVERDSDGARANAGTTSGGNQVTLSFDDDGLAGGARRGPLLAVRETTPAPQFVDWDGDGDLDVCALSATHLFVWVQEPAGTFTEAPTLELASPVERDMSRMLDVSYSAHAVELSGDGRTDCVIFAGDKRSDDFRTQGLVFVRGDEDPPLFGAEGLPRQVIVLAGFVAVPRFADVDGDERPDLVLAVIRPDLIDAVRAASTERLDAHLYVYLNQGGTFSKKPDLSHKVSLSADAEEYALRFVGDVTGDGILDLLVRDAGGTLSVYMVRRGKKGLEVIDRPVWELDVDPEADGRYPLHPGRAPEVLILSEEEVLCASFR